VPKLIAKIGINGYGVIGKRVADAISLQDDMKLVGISDIIADYRIKTAVEKGYSVYASAPEKIAEMKQSGIEVAGSLTDLLKKVDIIIDCTPAGVGAKNKPLYEAGGVKAIFQGGEKHASVQASFVAQCNYKEALGKQFVRVVSCNTTGICRSVGAVHKKYGAKKVRVVLVRRSGDPLESKTGPINAIVPEVHVPSHQGPDAQTVLRDLNIVTAACKVPTTLSHLHFVMLEPRRRLIREDLIKVFLDAPRIRLFKATDGFDGTQAIIEYHRDIGRSRSDVWELPIWEESIATTPDEVYWIMQVHQEAIVVPENVDAIRAMLELETDPNKSIAKTNNALGLVK